MSEHVAAAGGKLEVNLVLSHEQAPGPTHPQYAGIRLMDGLVADAAARAMAGRYDNIIGFVAGPPPMVDASLRLLIRDARVPPQFIRYDKFS